jgi:hypothetical protein
MSIILSGKGNFSGFTTLGYIVPSVSSLFTVNSITYGGTTVSSYSGSLTTGNMIISGIDASNSYNVYAFGASGQTYVITYTTNSPTTAYVLAVGGGGGGGVGQGGGGGAGGVVLASIVLPVGTNNTITVSVGGGGAGAGTPNNPLVNTYYPGMNGTDTTVTFSAKPSSNINAGGGCGGYGNPGLPTYTSTGSGGGGGDAKSGKPVYNSSLVNKNGTLSSGNDLYPYANDGGYGFGGANGGGGGAGAPGSTSGSADTANQMKGGNGIKCSLNGISTFNPSGTNPYGNYYWGGGGAGGGGAGGTGGLGGGGGGAGEANDRLGIGGGTAINSGSNATVSTVRIAGSGGRNTGGGGGGSYTGNTIGGNGGSGIVVIAFPAPFTPKSISGLNLWFDASDISGNGTTITNGTLINKWFDKSGLGNHATANTNITYNSTGLNSKSAMTFDSATKYLTGNNTISGPYLAMFVIASVNNSPAAVEVAIAFSSGLGVEPFSNQLFSEFTLNSTTGLIPFRNYFQPNPLPYLPPTSTPTLFEGWYDGSYMYSTAQCGSNTTLRTLPASTGNFSSTFFCIGNSTAPATNVPFLGSISEILVYNPSSALAYTDIQKIEGYLSWKWGLQGNLQTTHPYYNNPP